MSQEEPPHAAAQWTRREFLKTSVGASAAALTAKMMTPPAVDAAGSDRIEAAPGDRAGAEGRSRLKYKTPFHLRDGVIYDGNEQEVRLWGVNYYAPFNHNYRNIAELGIRHEQAIDEDIEHLKLLGADFLRMHLFDREISDRDGNIVENRHLEVFDYLIEKLAQAGIYLMLTPIAWWNSVENQVMQEQYYAYWHTGAGAAFGFSNYYGSDALLWHPDALACQKRYLEQLFSRKNKYSGKTLGEYENLVAVEIVNEPAYVTLAEAESNDYQPDLSQMHNAARTRAGERAPLVSQWRAFYAAHAGESKEAAFTRFKAKLVEDYLRTMFAVVDRQVARPYLKAHIFYNTEAAPFREMLVRHVDAITYPCYFTSPEGWDPGWCENADYFAETQNWFNTIGKGRVQARGGIIYEHDAICTMRGHWLGLVGKAFAASGMQMAALFTYCPAAAAAYNPGWQIHYLNFLHTPAKAAAFAAAGEIFRQSARAERIPADPHAWEGDRWRVSKERDLVYAQTGERLIYSTSIAGQPRGECPLEILGRGESAFAAYDGTGMYHLVKTGADWKLTVFPDPMLVNDPFRGRHLLGMPNHYVNLNKIPPVSRLLVRPHTFTLHLPGLESFTVTHLADGAAVAVKGNSFTVESGAYRISAASGA